jgi:hypothetical protein
MRCIDGEILGAIPGCPEVGCKGKLRLQDGKVTFILSMSGRYVTVILCLAVTEAAVRRMHAAVIIFFDASLLACL